MTQTTFTLNGVTYKKNESGYYYKSTGSFDKKGNEMMRRIDKASWEKAFDQYIAENENFEAEADAELKLREQKQAKNDKAAEEAMNEPKRSRKSVFHTSTAVEGLTLTEKQVSFILHLPDTCFWENGLDSTPWIDILADEIKGEFAGKPMTVGAMVSTLSEKDLVVVKSAKVNGRTAKFLALTDEGKKVAMELGLN